MKISFAILLVFGLAAVIAAVPTQDEPEVEQPNLEEQLNTPEEEVADEENALEDDFENEDDDDDNDSPLEDVEGPENDKKRRRCYAPYKLKKHCNKKTKKCYKCCTHCRNHFLTCKKAKRYCSLVRICRIVKTKKGKRRVCCHRRACRRIQSRCVFAGMCLLANCHNWSG